MKKTKRPTHAIQRSAWTQGGLDGLCGLYATINAVQYLRGASLKEEAAVDLFRHLTSAIPRRFPEVLWEGTSMQEVRHILDKADEYARKNYGFGVERSEPLLKSAPRRADFYWSRLEQLLEPKNRALLIGLKNPYEHWTVLIDVTPRTLRFLDSTEIKIARRVDFSMADGAAYRIDRHQVFLLERVAP